SYRSGFFFQAEDGIRDFHVTGVQTCALPIYPLPQGGRRQLQAAPEEHPVGRAGHPRPGGLVSKNIISVGRIVHYTSLGSAPQDGVQQYPSQCRAAIVTAVTSVGQGIVSLTVFNPEGLQFAHGVPFDAEKLALNGSATPGS